MLRALVVFVGLSTAASSDGEMPSRRMPTAAEVAAAAASINAALEQAKVLSEDADFRVELHNIGQSVGAQSVGAVGRVSQPALGSLDFPSPAAAVDPDKVLDAAQRLPRALRRGRASETTSLLAFVSLAMPDTQLQAIAAEAKALGARLLIRGLYRDDLQETLLRVKRLGIDDGISIDPTLFRLFSVTAVPTYVLALEPVVFDKSVAPKHVMAAGSVTLGYFLQRIERTQPGAIARCASRWADTSQR